MNELSTRTPAAIGAEIRDITANVRRVALGGAIEIGRRLDEAKALLPHGEWGTWLERETEFSQRQAQRMMQLYDAYGAAQIGIFGAELKATALTDLSISNALLLVAIPENEREAFAAEVDAEHISTRELEAAIKERDELKRKCEELGDELVAAKGDVGMLEEHRDKIAADLEAERQKVEELENRPVEVAVQEADPDEIAAAVDEAVRKAQQEADINLEKALDAAKVAAAKESAELVEKLNEARKAAEDAQKALDASVGADDPVRPSPDEIVALEQKAAQAESEAEALRKQLALSDAGTARFKVWFSQAQTCFQQMQAIIVECADADTAAKLSSALRKLVETWGASI